MKYPQFDNTQNCYDSDLTFFYEDGEGPHTREAKARELKIKQLCSDCKFLEPCREWGIAHEQYGFWGGMTEGERQQYRKDNNIILERPEIIFDSNYYELVARKIVKELD